MKSKKNSDKKVKNRYYKEWLVESLKDCDAAIAYLSAALEENRKEDIESKALFLLALKDVIEAQSMLRYHE